MIDIALQIKDIIIVSRLSLVLLHSLFMLGSRSLHYRHFEYLPTLTLSDTHSKYIVSWHTLILLFNMIFSFLKRLRIDEAGRISYDRNLSSLPSQVGYYQYDAWCGVPFEVNQ